MRNSIILGACMSISVVILTGCEDPTKSIAERAYFEGQRDAIDGDVRIEYDAKYGCYRWVKSPWNDGTKPTIDISGIPTTKQRAIK